MALPVPNLDDRRFQDLVDDAKRLVQQRCPEWTDHNVSDPGVTLIELFAWMTDQLLYRLNRVPDRNYVKFLELIGVQLFPPTAARLPMTFWLSAPQPDVLRIAANTEVATLRTDTDEAIVFATVEDLRITNCKLNWVATEIDGTIVDQTVQLDKQGFFCFDKVPKPGDALLVGLSDAVPSCAVALQVQCSIEGVGVDPNNPPLVWEAWSGDGWSVCELDRDETGGLNRDGEVVIHVPSTHVVSVIQQLRAGWLRVRVKEAETGQPIYGASPRINRAGAFTIGGTVAAVNAENIDDETLGISDGVPGQAFQLLQRPVIPGDAPLIVEASGAGGWQEWTEVSTFADSGPDDLHFVLEPAAGEIRLGPGLRLPDGSMRTYGAVPPKGSTLRVRSYRTGGGAQGNVARRAVAVLKSSIPYVARVENRAPGTGGVNGEDVDNAKTRGPIVFRTRGRAVTAEDYEEIAREAAPEVARVSCIAATSDADAGAVRVLIVPAVVGEQGRLLFEQLLPADETLSQIASRLDACRTLGARVVIEPPVYQGITVVARLKARAQANPARLQSAALEALYRYFHPIEGGPDGTGWPFGRPVQVGEVYSVLQALRGMELVEDARLFAADPVTGKRGDAVQRVEIDPNALVFSYEHQVLVEGA